jgi:dTMP kinase
MSKKLIIAFEGVEGSGKSFHLKQVAKYLKSKKIKFITLREPGGSKNAEKIRKLILNNKSNFNKKTDLLLYLASRSENVEKIIKKNYKKKIILIDRFIDSTLAYQHYGMGINKSVINRLNDYLLEKIKVDFTFLNLVNMINLKLRLSKRQNLNRYDNFKISFYKKIQNGFIKITKKNKKKYLLVNSNDSINENKKIILNKTNKLLGL